MVAVNLDRMASGRHDEQENPSMKIFLTGGTGVIGTRALPALSRPVTT